MEYLNNKTLQSLVLSYNSAKASGDVNTPEFEKLKVELADAFYLLARNILKAFRFQLIDNDDAIQEAVMVCFDKMHKFDPAKGLGFNFFSTCQINTYRQVYRTAKNYNELKVKYHVHLSDKNSDTHSNSLRAKKKTSSYKRSGPNDDSQEY